MALHNKTLGAAVKKYQPLMDENKSEDEIRLAISEDEKGFDEDGINEIFAALTTAGATKPDPNDKPSENEASKGKKAKGYVVAKGQSFKDIKDFSKSFNAGDDVSHFDSERLEKLVKAGLVKEA